jgi:PAS domain S-box-containing protein
MSTSNRRSPHAELYLTAAHLRALAAWTNVVLWITSADGSADIENPSWSAFTGQPPDEYLGWGWLEAIHPDDRERIRKLWSSTVSVGNRAQFSYRLRRRDGEYRLVNVEGVAVDTERGFEWVGYCIDVTEASQTEYALRANEERLRFLDQLAQTTRALTDPIQIMAMTARLLGEQLQATRCAYADVEADNDTFTIRSDWSTPGVRSSAGVYSLSLFGPHAVGSLRNGEYLIVHDVDRELGDEGGGRMFNSIGIKAIICAPLVKEGKLAAMMAVHQSTPRQWTPAEVLLVGEVVDRCWAHIERVRYAAMLEMQDRRKNEFLATLAHELRNPLAPMRYAAAIMKKASPGAPASIQAQQIIERQVGFMARLVDDLLDLSRISRGLIELKREQASLAELVTEAVDAMRPVIEAARHDLEVVLPATEVTLDADRTRIVQVISNLLSNAAKYTPDGGAIRVAAWQEGSRAVLEVRDNGIGIPPAEQGRLFEMFTQLPHTAAHAQGGLGIGLALVKTLVQMHGGQIRVASRGLDEGSTFTVELPAIVPEARPCTRTDVAADPGGLSVLVVEDNPDGLLALVMLLELMDCVVRSAADGQAGLELASLFKPDVAILDLGLPRMDGLTLARRLRADPALAGMTLVALTGWGSTHDRERTRDAGFDHHLTKPVEPDELRRLLSATRDQKRLLTERG